MKEFTFGSLFAGIGGMDLGLERAGMVCKWQVEIDPFCLKVLEKHWPDVRRFEDVKDCGKRNLDPVDLVCGGFPCQDVSVAGKRKGLKGERSGLWFEMLRIVRELEPRWVLVENVPGLLSVDSGRGFGTVLRDLAESGCDAEWDCIPAAAFGAPHLRYRVFVVAYYAQGQPPGFPNRESGRQNSSPRSGNNRGRQKRRRNFENVAYSQGEQGRDFPEDLGHGAGSGSFLGPGGFDAGTLAHDDGFGCEKASRGFPTFSIFGRGGLPKSEPHWEIEPPVGRVADGVPRRVDRLGSLGNAVVPQVAEWIGRRIMEADEKWIS